MIILKSIYRFAKLVNVVSLNVRKKLSITLSF
jgi:hypothetical protein